jgi:hypothetical protein
MLLILIYIIFFIFYHSLGGLKVMTPLTGRTLPNYCLLKSFVRHNHLPTTKNFVRSSGEWYVNNNNHFLKRVVGFTRCSSSSFS